MRRDPQERFWEKVNRNGGFADFADPLVRVTIEDGECWTWTGATTGQGYGLFWDGNKSVLAHRFAMPGHPFLDHLCRRPACVRHLEGVTQSENVLRGKGSRYPRIPKTVCHNGHQLTADNVYTRPGRSERDCRQCRVIRRRRFNERRKS